MSGWALVVDVELCINCRNCAIATKDEFVGNDHVGYSAPHPNEGLEVIRIERHERGSGSQLDVKYIPRTCNHCDNAPCIAAARDGSIYKRADGIVVIDPKKSKGRKDLTSACPYGMIFWNEEQDVPQNWIFDAHLLDKGWAQPRCVQACPTEALKAVKKSAAELRVMVAEQGLTVLKPELGTRPRVFYRNLDKALTHILTGTVVRVTSGGREENAADLVVTLREPDSGVEAIVQTDAFGDFRFVDLKSDLAGFTITCVDVSGATLEVVGKRHGSINVGTIALR